MKRCHVLSLAWILFFGLLFSTVTGCARSEKDLPDHSDPNTNLSDVQEDNGEGGVDFPFFKSFQVMDEQAEVIVTGTLSNYLGIHAVELSDELSLDYHIYEISVGKSLKGEYDSGDVFKLKVLASEPGAGAANLLQKDYQTYLFYLSIYDDSPATLLSPDQAIVAVDSLGDIHYTQMAHRYIQEGEATGLSEEAMASIFS